MRKILVMARIPRIGLAKLEDDFELIYPDNFSFTEEELLAILPEVEGVLSVFTIPFRRNLLERASKLRIIANFGVGFNNIDVAYATSKGIIICNTPNAVTEPTAEMALGLLISLMRRISETDRKLRIDPNFKWGMMENLGASLWGKTLGIIGMGRIGKALARRCLACGMKIVYFNRTQLSPEEEAIYKTKWCSLDQLLSISDVVSLNCPLSDSTHHLIGKRELGLMKNSGYLINTARGPVVDETALVAALRSGQIAGAGLDVFEEEPGISEPLLGMDNVVLTPHNATGTIDTRIETAMEAAESLSKFFANDYDIPIVNREVLL